MRRCDAARREAWNGQRCPAKWRNWEDRPQPAQILLRGAPLPAFCACSRTWIGPEHGRGRGWSIQRRSFKAGRGKAGLDRVEKDPSDLGGIGDDGEPHSREEDRDLRRIKVIGSVRKTLNLSWVGKSAG